MKKRTKKYILSGLVIILFIGIFIPQALSYLSDTRERGISIRATPAEEIWEISGTFDENRWKKNNHTGIYLKNKSERDLWLNFEYTGDLVQVFKASDAVLLPAGVVTEIVLYPLDEADSPRILNPLDLIGCTIDQTANHKQGGAKKCMPVLQWRNFSGKLKINILNQYAGLESDTIKISGETLWQVYFARKFGLDSDTYYEQCWEAGDLTPKMKNNMVKSTQLEGAELNNLAETNISDTRDAIQKCQSYQPLNFLQPVLQVVEKVAPGLLKERSSLLSSINELQEKLENMLNIIESFKAQEQKLRDQISGQQDLINTLSERLYESEKTNQNLTEQLNTHSDSPPAAVQNSTDSQSGSTNGGSQPGAAETGPTAPPSTDTSNDSPAAAPAEADSDSALP